MQPVWVKCEHWLCSSWQWYPGSEPIDNAAARGHVSQPRIQTENWDSFSPQQGPRPNFITWKSNEELRQWHFTLQQTAFGLKHHRARPSSISNSHTSPSFSLRTASQTYTSKGCANCQMEQDREQPSGWLRSTIDEVRGSPKRRDIDLWC